jgi:6-phosphogluconolactonase/glucosamine-6-phosphate isomerase/deaminase
MLDPHSIYAMKVRGFHMDEYIGLPSQHPASFRGYLHARLTEKVPLREFSEVEGTASDAEAFSLKYAAKLRAAEPQLLSRINNTSPHFTRTRRRFDNVTRGIS